MPSYLISFNDEWVSPHTHEQLLANRDRPFRHWELANGAPVYTDGPYAETKEHLGGFTIVEVADDEAARYWAGRLAVALDWPQEVHRFPAPPQAGPAVPTHTDE